MKDIPEKPYVIDDKKTTKYIELTLANKVDIFRMCFVSNSEFQEYFFFKKNIN